MRQGLRIIVVLLFFFLLSCIIFFRRIYYKRSFFLQYPEGFWLRLRLTDQWIPYCTQSLPLHQIDSDSNGIWNCIYLPWLHMLLVLFLRGSLFWIVSSLIHIFLGAGCRCLRFSVTFSFRLS